MRIWYGYARVVVALRWFLIAGWAGAAVAAMVLLPPLGTTQDDLEALGAGDASFAAEQRSTEIFGFPLLSRVAMVQHDPDGMEPLAQAEAVLRGIAVNQGSYDTEILGAVPIPNTEGVLPGQGMQDTTVVTFLFLDPRDNFFVQKDEATAFAEEQLTDASDAYVGVTGSVPARAAQGEIVNGWVHVVEGATLLAILLDFTGYGCVNCRKTEEHIWSRESIRKRIDEEFVLVSLYVDDKMSLDTTLKSAITQQRIRTIGQKWTDFQVVNFNQNSQPLYVIMSPDQQVLTAPRGYDPDYKGYEAFLECGLNTFKELGSPAIGISQ